MKSKIKSIGYVKADNYWPRKAAIHVLKQHTRREMEIELKKVPEEFKEYVKDYLNDWAIKAGGLTKLKDSIK